jgi:hypothetical protein
VSRTPEISAVGVIAGLALAALPFMFDSMNHGDVHAYKLVVFPLLGLAIAVPSAVVFVISAIRAIRRDRLGKIED